MGVIMIFLFKGETKGIKDQDHAYRYDAVRHSNADPDLSGVQEPLRKTIFITNE